MKRYMIVGIAVVAILGIAITMALASNPAMADNAFDGANQVGTVIDDGGDTETARRELADTAVTQDPIATPTGQNFVDEDGDGVCDTCDSVPGTGTGSQYGNGAAGSNFIDLDGDGVCDDCGTAPADGTGSHYGNGAAGSNFIDLDGDGVCDDCTPLAPADGTGNQYGRQGGQGGQGQGQGQRGGGRGNN